ncbi:hypothetical protein AALB_4070 [Agarivorans albus MKT 106]|uniref:Uncharacterized protein n=1 Tax=Agarivorans albus MKT 106 TaxID=1331007 RepID=R9PRR4_AGAAL|nr:hypothetical protein AALB_4070 [Agarivorans albus MKT 106]
MNRYLVRLVLTHQQRLEYLIDHKTAGKKKPRINDAGL